MELKKRKYDRLYMQLKTYKKQDKTRVYFFIGIFLLILFLLILWTMMKNDFLSGNWSFDLFAINYMDSIRNEMFDHIFKVITSTGNVFSTVMITLIITVFLLYLKKKKQALFFSANILGLWLFNEALKQIFKRSRPLGLRLVEVSGYSFPSGHSMVFMGLSILLIYYILSYIQNKRIATLINSLIFIYSMLVGLSRVYVGVHYLSDVLAGWAIGTLWALASIILYKTLNDRKNRN